MKKAFPVITAALMGALLGACTDDTGDASGGNVLETQQQALDRARNVEEDVAEAARRRAEEIERSEGSG